MRDTLRTRPSVCPQPGLCCRCWAPMHPLRHCPLFRPEVATESAAAAATSVHRQQHQPACGGSSCNLLAYLIDYHTSTIFLTAAAFMSSSSIISGCRSVRRRISLATTTARTIFITAACAIAFYAGVPLTSVSGNRAGQRSTHQQCSSSRLSGSGRRRRVERVQRGLQRVKEYEAAPQQGTRQQCNHSSVRGSSVITAGYEAAV